MRALIKKMKSQADAVWLRLTLPKLYTQQVLLQEQSETTTAAIADEGTALDAIIAKYKVSATDREGMPIPHIACCVWHTSNCCSSPELASQPRLLSLDRA